MSESSYTAFTLHVSEDCVWLYEWSYTLCKEYHLETLLFRAKVMLVYLKM